MADQLEAENFDGLFRLTYRELRAMAEGLFAAEDPGHTWPPTALVHEAYLKLRAQTGTVWKNKSQFLAVAAQAMRRLLIDHARAKRAQKREGSETMLSLDAVFAFSAEICPDVIALNESLDRLAHVDYRQAKVVELRFFGGLSVEETAEVLSVSPETVKRDWKYAKAWLYGDLRGQHEPD